VFVCVCVCVCVDLRFLSFLPTEPHKLAESPRLQLFLDATLYMHTCFHPGLRSLSVAGGRTPPPRVVSSSRACLRCGILNRSARDAVTLRLHLQHMWHLAGYCVRFSLFIFELSEILVTPRPPGGHTSEPKKKLAVHQRRVGLVGIPLNIERLQLTSRR